ncbi:hypothetical protein [Effusibacillus consociatus]|uniref:Uncharacterized protein n=1 Tax=Effusibacillus consociatus TaxID=1117041 RepID=A0ABV9PZ41_9BACL
MAIILKEGENEKGLIEFYLVGLECFDDFDAVLDVLVNVSNAKVIEKIDGIYSRIGKLEVKDTEFKLIYHEDVGIYLYVINQSPASNNLLRKILQNLVSVLEKSL